ncbi:tryptophan 7-halogenase [uncultured Mameliella sp.]|uniref:tryptophan halogenase family protein n=1 Tax=uncultured Mameliella sp. TaxID=1447087 RepID=UPI002632D9FC|nr:tryptophan 7-halogenase [uncultured Mameliella sp.]
MTAPIRNITIVGGGTAGWLAAALLNSLLREKRPQQDAIEITLIESPDIPTVGVGEATVPNMPRTLADCGISEAQFFRCCNSSFKLGVLFDHWNVDETGAPIRYVNPFDPPPPIDGVPLAAYYLKYGAGDLEFAQLFSPCLDLREEMRGPRPFRAGEYPRGPGFAYHLDAGKFAALLRETCVARGVHHVYDNLQELELSETGDVAALHLEKGGRHAVELVLDCTGFRGLIINQALGSEFLSYSKYLANDRAMAVQVPHLTDDIEPMTRSTALGAGWTWRVPLYNRVGTGYVYSSAHRTDEAARDEFMQWVGPAGEGLEPRVIPMRVGRNRQNWVRNCVAVGLSSGFIEPLESTAIHLVDMSVRQLITYFPDTSYPEPLRARYNRQMERLYDEVRDFICLHYALGNRTDSQYWIDARKELKVSDALAENLALWRHTLPQAGDLDSAVLFSPQVYHAVLLGKRVYDMGFKAENFAAGYALDEDRWWDFVARNRAKLAQFTNRAANHRHLLREIRGELMGRERRAVERGETVSVARAEAELADSSLL